MHLYEQKFGGRVHEWVLLLAPSGSYGLLGALGEVPRVCAAGLVEQMPKSSQSQSVRYLLHLYLIEIVEGFAFESV